MRSVLATAVIVLCGCHEKIRIHEEEPTERETICSCVYQVIVPTTHTECHTSLANGHGMCDTTTYPDTHYVHGRQRCRVRERRYSYRYENDRPTQEARIDTETLERIPLDECR